MPSWANPIRLSRQRIFLAVGCGVATIALFVGQAFWDSENQAVPQKPPPEPTEIPATTLPTYQPTGWPEPPVKAGAVAAAAEVPPEEPKVNGTPPDDAHQQILKEQQQTNRHFKTLLDVLSKQQAQPTQTPKPTITKEQAEAERKRLAEERKRERDQRKREREEYEAKLKAWKPQWVKPDVRKEDQKGRVHTLKTPWSLAPNTVISFVTEAKITNQAPGAFRAFVSEPVKDSATQTLIVLPTGTALGMEPAGKSIYGDERISLQMVKVSYRDKWMEFPKTSIGDRLGTAGFQDLIDRHPWRFLMAGLLGVLQGGTTLMAQASQGVAGPVGASVGNQISQQGTQEVRQLLRTEPTITIRPAYQGTVMLLEALELNEPLL